MKVINIVDRANHDCSVPVVQLIAVPHASSRGYG